ncbi:hypothetical protein CAEBREN_00899 [Caenorhabditis brenneri]|uniref:Uncharacterized protein n=1 Tax=Caenorhabditis brenneri TaxID=135651 RepID=G0N6F1_CAEBE|nr:hypothetical protein CAEBREN_00899 [Caenorhabditis brenneri]
MRRIIIVLIVVVLLPNRQVLGFASAPGTYPEEETKAGNDLEMPKNPYQSGWTGYDFYYEKGPKKASSSGGSGKMPAFQSIESVSSDRESPDDPGNSVYQASGSEFGSAKQKTSSSPPEVTPPPSIKSTEKVMVSPSASTKDLTPATTTQSTTQTTTSVSTTTALIHSTVPKLSKTEINAQSMSEMDPESGLDQSAADNLELLYAGETPGSSQKDSTPNSISLNKVSPHAHDPPPPSDSPKNLLTMLMEKKVWKQKSELEGLEKKLNFDSHESGYGPSTNMKSSKWSGHAPGTEPALFTASLVVPSSDYGQNEGKSTASPSDGPNLFHNGSESSSRSENRISVIPHQNTLQKPTLSLDTIQHTSPTKTPSTHSSIPPVAQINHMSPLVLESQGEYGEPSDNEINYPSLENENKSPIHQPGTEPRVPQAPLETAYKGSSEEQSTPMKYGAAPGSEPNVPGGHAENHALLPAETYQPDVLDYGARPNNRVGATPKNPRYPSLDKKLEYSNSNNALSPRDPYDHFGTTANHHQPLAPSPLSSHQMSRENFEEDAEDDSGYGNNDVNIVPLRSTHSTTTSTNTEVRAQISEIDRIAESFENSAREPVEYEQKITSESSKGITVEAGKSLQKKLGRKANKCCSCCDEKQPVSRNIETKVEPLHVQQAVDPSAQLGERDPVQNYVPLQSSVGGSAYVQQPASSPVAPVQQTFYQQPFQQYQPQYPQSYPSQQPSCGCQPQPQNCCPPPAPCCLRKFELELPETSKVLATIPCCPPIPCCPQPKICCQPTPICLPPQQCCSINFKLPTIPVCGRACPSCPCRRRVHKSLRLKRHAISSNCHQCSAAGEPWKSVLHHREKRAAAGCSSGFSTMQQSSCGTCGASHLRSTRVKRMGCLPCLGRKKRDTEEHVHTRVKRMGCLPCLGRKKRSALSLGCSQCNSLGHLLNRYKRSLFGCSSCAPQPACGCQGRKKRSVTMKIVKRAPEKCDASCCDYSRCLNRQKKETLVPFM